MKKIIAAAIFTTLLSIQNSTAQTTSVLRVPGMCDMCKKRIELAADIKGVKDANYNLEKKELTIVYKPEKVDIQTIAAEILKIGYDVDSLRAPDEAYKKLDHCCQYDRHQH
ncbi:MAG: heavy-metal-associated domain-containing protein [Bacteroidia bacterium]|jgi:mercuric ion binding protein